MNIALVPPDRVMSIWNDIRDYLEPAVKRSNGRWTMEHLAAALAVGRSQVWVAFETDGKIIGTMTTEIANYPGKRVLAMHFLGGEDFDLWYGDMLQQISCYAKDADCDGLEGVARFGFWKWLEADGFEKSSAFYEKGMKNG
jgi:hypothetical protein